MTVLRIVPNIAADDPAALGEFYRALLGIDVQMDLGFIVTLGGSAKAPVQVSLASEGGSGTPVPALSVEVSDLEETLGLARSLGAPVVYGPRTEPWGVRRFFLRDPVGTLVNIVSHT